MMQPDAPLLTAVGVYERVSSDDQRDRETIKTQTAAIDQYLAAHPEVRVHDRYLDDGVSGSIPLTQRPEGRRLVRDGMDGRFTAVLVTRADRLGRNAGDVLRSRDVFDDLGIKLVGVVDAIDNRVTFGILAVLSQDEKERFLARSAEGMARAAREGRYCGGIVPFGYKVEGRKEKAVLVASDVVVWGDQSAAAIVRWIYKLLAQGRSCPWIADELNRLGVPTAYVKDGRGVRGKRTQGKWRSGRIRNLVINPVNKGALQYGRRTNRRREVISAPVEALVSVDLWEQARAALAKNRRVPSNASRQYLLRGLLKCSICGLTYVGSFSNGSGWYRCGGQLVERGPIEGRCLGKSIKCATIEAIAWQDIEHFLRNPGQLLAELENELKGASAQAIAEAEANTYRNELAHLDEKRQRIIDAYVQNVITVEELKPRLDELDEQRREVAGRLLTLETAEENAAALTPDLLNEIRQRLDDSLTDQQKQEIARLLVERIVVNTDVHEDRKKTARLTIYYRFADCSDTSTGTGSSRTTAGNLPER